MRLQYLEATGDAVMTALPYQDTYLMATRPLRPPSRIDEFSPKASLTVGRVRSSHDLYSVTTLDLRQRKGVTGVGRVDRDLWF